MLDIHIGGVHCKISLLFPAVLLLLLLTDASGISAFGFLSAMIHECGHIAAILLFHEKPASVTVSLFGMRMVLPKCCQLCEWQSVVIFAAGPLMNVLCAGLLFLLHTPTIFVWIHLLLAAVNSLPVMPLDGGQVLMVMLRAILPSVTAETMMRGLHWIFCVCLMLLGMAVLRYSGYNFTLLVLAVYICLLGLFYKID